MFPDEFHLFSTYLYLFGNKRVKSKLSISRVFLMSLMDSMPAPGILGFIFAGLGLSLVILARHSRPSLPYPPGPVGEWIFGNARQTPTERQWVAFAKWTERYGARIHIFLMAGPHPYGNVQGAIFSS